MMFNCIFQIFEWWYFKKYGTSFIEQVSLNHISPLLGGNDNPNQENNNTTPSSSSSSSSSSNSTHQQSMPGTVGYTAFEEKSVLRLVCKCWSVCPSVRPSVCPSDCLSVRPTVCLSVRLSVGKTCCCSKIFMKTLLENLLLTLWMTSMNRSKV